MPLILSSNKIFTDIVTVMIDIFGTKHGMVNRMEIFHRYVGVKCKNGTVISFRLIQRTNNKKHVIKLMIFTALFV